MSEINLSFLKANPTPKGYVLYTDTTRIRGMNYRELDVLKFIKGKNHMISLREAGPKDPFPGGWEVIGHWSGMIFKKSVLLGYVPSEMNEQATRSGLKQLIKIRLAKIWLATDGDYTVQFQLIGPRDKQKIFKSFAQEYSSDPRYINANVKIDRDEEDEDDEEI